MTAGSRRSSPARVNVPTRAGCRRAAPSWRRCAKARGIATEAAKLPEGAGGRRTYPMGMLVPGGPWAATLRNITKAAERPVTTAEVALALLEMHKTHREGPQLGAVVNRASALLARQAKRGVIARIPATEDRRQTWVWVWRSKTTGAVAQPARGSLEPSGWIGQTPCAWPQNLRLTGCHSPSTSTSCILLANG